MANRYWVGGTASWDNTAGTKWSETSGGPGGASAPTVADDVFIDANSGVVTVTIATGNTGAKSINCTGFIGTVTGSALITVAGSVTLVPTMTYTHTGGMLFIGTGTLTTAGQRLNGVDVSGVGITLTLGSALTSDSTIVISNGNFDTGNYSVTATAIRAVGEGTRSINLGSSNILLTGSECINFQNATTVNAGTSTISITATNAEIEFIGNDQTFYNVIFSTQRPLITIFGSNTFNNLSFQGRTTSGVSTTIFTADQTVNGILTLSAGTNVTMRRVIASSVTGTTRTLTCNNVAALTDIDFCDIAFAGNCISGGNITGTRLGNGKGNSNITFDAPKTVYYRATGSANWGSTSSWSLTSGGAATAAAFPLAQDSVIFPAATYPASGSTTTINGNYLVTTIDMSLRTTNTMTLSVTAAEGIGLIVLGNWINGTGTTITNTSATVTFQGRTAQTITTAGKTFGASRPITIDSPGGSVTLNGVLTCATLTVTQGTFDTANFNVTASNFNSNNTNVRTITLGSSVVELSGGINFTDSTNLSFNANTSQINLSGTSSQLRSAGVTFYNVSFTGTSVGTRSITGENTFNNLTLSTVSPGIAQLSIAADQIINGALTCAGSTALRRGFVSSNIVGTVRTITAASISANDCDFRDITLAGAAAGASPTRAGDCGGNSGITFPAPKTVYRVENITTWAGANSWSLTSGGNGSDNNFPLAQDTAVIDNSTTLTGTLAFGVRYNVSAIDCSSRTSAITLNHNVVQTIYGSYTLGSGVTVSGTSQQTFSGRGTMAITSAGKTITFPISVETYGGTFQLNDAFSSSNFVIIIAGAFDANNYNLSATRYAANFPNTRTITMGSGLWTLSNAGTTTTNAPWSINSTTGLTFNKSTGNILLSNNTTSPRVFIGGGLSYNKLTIGGNTSTSILTINGANSFTELASTKTVAHTVRFADSQGTIDTWSITGTSGNVVTVDSSVAGTQRTFTLTNVTSGIDYLSVKDIGELSGSKFYVGTNSTDGGNNSNVYFIAPPIGPTFISLLGGLSISGGIIIS